MNAPSDTCCNLLYIIAAGSRGDEATKLQQSKIDCLFQQRNQRFVSGVGGTRTDRNHKNGSFNDF